MNTDESKINDINNIFIYDREKAKLSGISDVEGFTDTNIVVTCKYGSISIEGEGLKIDSFDSATGDLCISGTVDGMFYFGNSAKSKKSKKSRLFS